MWKELKSETEKEYFQNILKFIETNKETIAPSPKNIFRVFTDTSLKDVKVVILGQDPYPTPGDANGRAFAVNSDIKIPKSLKNIFKEIQTEFGEEPKDRTLDYLANQGVFLLNTCLSTNQGSAFAHKNLGWQKFTDAVIKTLNNREEPIIFFYGVNRHMTKKS